NATVTQNRVQNSGSIWLHAPQRWGAAGYTRPDLFIIHWNAQITGNTNVNAGTSWAPILINVDTDVGSPTFFGTSFIGVVVRDNTIQGGNPNNWQVYKGSREGIWYWAPYAAGTHDDCTDWGNVPDNTGIAGLGTIFQRNTVKDVSSSLAPTSPINCVGRYNPSAYNLSTGYYQTVIADPIYQNVSNNIADMVGRDPTTGLVASHASVDTVVISGSSSPPPTTAPPPVSGPTATATRPVSGPTATATAPSTVSLTVSPASAAAGGTVTATWSGIASPTSTDWIGLYTPGAANTATHAWTYVSCSSTAGSARAAGSCAFPVPATLSAGSYELRLFANDSYTRLLTTSNAFSVGGAASTTPLPPSTATRTATTTPLPSSTATRAATATPLPPSTATRTMTVTPTPTGSSTPGRTTTTTATALSAVSLTVSPTSAAAGGTVTATWSGIASPTATDWIGLYAPGAANTATLAWAYVSCSSAAGSARAAGSCAFPLPATLSAGSYELRLFANDSYTRLLTT